MKRMPWALLCLLMMAFALRVWGLNDRNIWWDEGLTAWAARLPAAQVIDWTAHDVHPPLYFLLQGLWHRAVGDGEFVMRYTSVLVGVLGVALIYGLGRSLGGRLAGLLAALLLAVSPFAVSWSQEMRMYIAAATLAIASLWAARHFWRTGSLRAWALYVAASTAGLWMLYLSVSVWIIAVLGFGVLWVRDRAAARPRLVPWIAAHIVGLALYAPWLLYALPRMPSWSTAEPFTVGFFLRLYAVTLAVGLPVHIERYLWPALAVMAIFVITAPLAWARTRSGASRAAWAMLWLGVLLPPLLVYLVSLPIHLFYAPRLAPRYLIPLAACFYTLLALGLAAWARRSRLLAAGLTGVVVAVSVLGLLDFYPGRVRRDDLVSLADTLDAQRRADDPVLVYSDKDWPLFAAQYAGPWRGAPHGETMDEQKAGWLLEPLWQSGDGLWLVTTPDAVRMDPQAAVRRWLEAHAAAVTTWDYGENSLAFYARRADAAAQIAALSPAYRLRPRAATWPQGALAAATVPLPRYPVGDTLHLALIWRRPPDQPVQVTLAGPVTRSLDAAPAPAVGSSRQQVDVPLSPDLPAGRYRVLVQMGAAAPLEAGRFDVLPPRLGAQAALSRDATPLDWQLGPSIRLLGYRLANDAVQPGQSIELTLYWQTDQVVTERYKVFTHLLGDVWNAATGNFIWGQVDAEPQAGAAAVTTWTPGAVVVDSYTIPVPTDAPAGVYRLEVGLYGLVNGQRLPVQDGQGHAAGDAILLGQVTVGRTP